MSLIDKTLINAAGEVRSQDFEQKEYVDIDRKSTRLNSSH